MIKNYWEVIYLSHINCIRYRSTQLVHIGCSEPVWLLLFCLTFTSLGSFSQKKKLNLDNVICRTSFIIVLRARTLFSSFNYGFLQRQIHRPCWRTSPMQQSTMSNTTIFPFATSSNALETLSMRYVFYSQFFMLPKHFKHSHDSRVPPQATSVATSSMLTANTPTQYHPPHLQHGKRSHITVCHHRPFRRILSQHHPFRPNTIFDTPRPVFGQLELIPPVSFIHQTRFWLLQPCFTKVCCYIYIFTLLTISYRP